MPGMLLSFELSDDRRSLRLKSFSPHSDKSLNDFSHSLKKAEYLSSSCQWNRKVNRRVRLKTTCHQTAPSPCHCTKKLSAFCLLIILVVNIFLLGDSLFSPLLFFAVGRGRCIFLLYSLPSVKASCQYLSTCYRTLNLSLWSSSFRDINSRN